MKIVESWKNEPIYGTVCKNEHYYVIRDKETQEYDCRDGELCNDIMDANWFQYYKEAQEVLKQFDEPDKFDIIMISCFIKLEEVM